MTDGPEQEKATGILTHQDIETLVRFYDQDRGFGFVQVADGSPDAFLVRSTLAQGGYADVQTGDIIFCSIVTGSQDPRVQEVYYVDRDPFGRVTEMPSAARGVQEGERSSRPPRNLSTRWRA
jgi:CspA family cold shock protein